jgi:NSS family neurotransmitter:Na+ symporter
VAFVAGLAVFPLIFALGLSDQVGESTVGALFITLPHTFAQMDATGKVVGFLFFAALVVGALTSAISLLEVVVASAIDNLGWTRQRSALVLGGLITALGIPAALSLDTLDWMDKTLPCPPGPAVRPLLHHQEHAASLMDRWARHPAGSAPHRTW